MRRVFRLAAAVLVGLIAPCVVRGETIGAAVVARSVTDTAAGSIFALNSGFTQAGTLTSWSYYNDNPAQAGFVVTPLLLSVSGGNYIITGVGTPGANAATGAQSFGFGLTSGSAAVGPGTLFGWKDGTDPDPSQTGVIQFDFVGAPSAGTQQWFFGGHSGDLFAGSNLGAGLVLGAGVGQPDRDYSLQATATAVPEPASLTLLAASTLGLLGYGWRRKRPA